MDSLTPTFQFYRTDPRHVSKSITLKARSLLTLYQQGKRVYSQIGQTGYLKIDLGVHSIFGRAVCSANRFCQ
ncbi:hypothetical protein R198_07700 [Salmonella enterica]|nr:hypothetical protein [Salmonella enterica]EAY4593608.1 hypothetical protein [Salmonella enterica]EBO9330450.1 hypothetical protein [Salmonella enterica]